jgi:hypothetical protein
VLAFCSEVCNNRYMKNYEKHSNPALAKAMQELRRSSAAQPHANRARYNRKRQDWKKEL